MNFSWTLHAQERTRERFKKSSREVDVRAFTEMEPEFVPYPIGATFRIHTKVGKKDIVLVCRRENSRKIKVVTVLYPHEVYKEMV